MAGGGHAPRDSGGEGPIPWRGAAERTWLPWPRSRRWGCGGLRGCTGGPQRLQLETREGLIGAWQREQRASESDKSLTVLWDART